MPALHRLSASSRRALALGLVLFSFAQASPAALQFDVFLGYDSIVPEASWFPIVIEVNNDGPTFTGTIEVKSERMSEGQTRRLQVELPTGTTKRLVIPVFAGTRFSASTWDVLLYDERGKERGKQLALQPKRQIGPEATLIGALARTASGTPAIRPILSQDPEFQPASARLLPAIFPDNPLVLEAMSTIYLNSEKAAELSVSQVRALVAWLNAGGHLIVAVEQLSEVSSMPWLNQLFPCELKDMQTVERHTEVQEWLKQSTGPTNLVSLPNQTPPPRMRPRKKGGPTVYGGPPPPGMAPKTEAQPALAVDRPFGDLPDDFTFEASPMQVATCTLRDGSVVLSASDRPLMVTASRGRGRITALLFSPEREPFRSWKNLPTFWAKLAEVPNIWYVSADFQRPGGWSSDAVFGAMLDTKQVHKLPVGWLLLLLIAYLVVIGPLDQYWLKKIGKPMLTWITFPCYVVLFSLLIYFIGYRLRAGESEWNELHIVDVLQHGDGAELRGRTYASVYSPVNQKFPLESLQPFATLRGEFAGNWNSGGQSSERADVLQKGDAFKAEIFVPVWTSQLFVSDWWEPSPRPLDLTVTPKGEGWSAVVENRGESKLSNLQLVVEDRIFGLGDVAARESKTFAISPGKGVPLQAFVMQHGQNFQQVISARQSTFGSSESGHIEDLPDSAVAVSFISQLTHGNQQTPGNYQNFIAPPGLDLSSVAAHGNAVLLAWAGDYSPVKPIYHFSPRRKNQDTLWRVAVPIRELKAENL